MPLDLSALAKERIIVFDGAMGTSIQKYNLSEEDYLGKEGCSEILNTSKPEVIKEIHASYLEAGCDVVETNTFGATKIVLGEYDLADQDYELNKKAAGNAKEVSNDFSTNSKPRYVAGSVGPGTKLPSLLQIPFDELKEAFSRQMHGLLAGGVDMLIIETFQDLLQLKAALVAAFEVFEEKKVRVPVIAQVTMETNGKMLLGSDMLTTIVTVSPFPVDALGLNCALGPKGMTEHLEVLAEHWDRLISVLPNAGMPKIKNEEVIYDLDPEDFAEDIGNFAGNIGANIVGGCCGTAPAHIKAVVDRVVSMTPKQRTSALKPSASSLYNAVEFDTHPKPLIIGERLNSNGSKRFRDYLVESNIDGMLALAHDQEKEQAHVLDVCVAYTGIDEKKSVVQLVEKLNTDCHIPLMIDSTDPEVIEEALKRIGGKAIINSVNLEDGGEKLRSILHLCKKYGAAVVALTIDEDGMAEQADKKMEIAQRMQAIATEEFSIPEGDIFFDMLTFTLGSGDKKYREAAVESLQAIKKLKEIFPQANTILGVSNVSYGLAPHIRSRLNSVFLAQAIEHGLDAAILHAGKILPLHKIPDGERQLLNNLIFNKWDDDSNPLLEVLNYYKKTEVEETKPKDIFLPVEKRLKKRIIDGEKFEIEKDLKACLEKMSALDIINSILLAGMKTVGELFGSGEMQLPFVLQSAETMKTAVEILKPHIESQEESVERGKIVIATVKGDVHDIGKNLVDIILSNNGYTVVNIGIKQNIDAIIDAYKTSNADAIGLSGLLVQSTLEMKKNLEAMNKMNLSPPVILGGAALTQKYVDETLNSVYKGNVYYAKDAFDGLQILSDIARGEKKRSYGSEKKYASSSSQTAVMTEPEKIEPAEPPTPPFRGTKTVKNIPLDAVIPYINKRRLFLTQWGLKKRNIDHKKYDDIIRQEGDETLQKIIQKTKEEKLIEPQVVYGYFPCNSENEKLHVYENTQSTEPFITFDFPRQRGPEKLCISDYFHPLSSGKKDVIAFQLVTIGNKAAAESKRLFESDDYKAYLYWHGFSVEFTEALAQYWHRQIRKELHIDQRDSENIQNLFRGEYQGRRFAFGYPACPDLTNQKKLFTILKPERINVELTETLEMVPEESTSALIVHHPQAKYFAI